MQKLNRLDKRILDLLIHAEKPMSLWQIAEWLGCSNKKAELSLIKIAEGMRIFRTDSYDFFIAIDESKLTVSDEESQEQYEQGKLL